MKRFEGDSLVYVEEMIHEHEEFYEELMRYRGEITNTAEKQAWIDWAADLISVRQELPYEESVGLLMMVESYYIDKGWL